MLWFSIPRSFTPPIPLPVTDCKLFGINVLKAGFVFVFMQMFSELDPTFLSIGKEFPCGQQLGITSYAEVMVKLWYLLRRDYSLYGGRWTFLTIYLSRLDIKINIFSNVCMIDVAISLFILFPD